MLPMMSCLKKEWLTVWVLWSGKEVCARTCSNKYVTAIYNKSTHS